MIERSLLLSLLWNSSCIHGLSRSAANTMLELRAMTTKLMLEICMISGGSGAIEEGGLFSSKVEIICLTQGKSRMAAAASGFSSSRTISARSALFARVIPALTYGWESTRCRPSRSDSPIAIRISSA